MLGQTAEWVQLYLLIVALSATSSTLRNNNTASNGVPEILKNLYPTYLVHDKTTKGVSENTMPAKLNISYMTTSTENMIKANKKNVTHLPVISKQDIHYTNSKDIEKPIKNIVHSNKTNIALGESGPRMVEDVKVNKTNTETKMLTTLKSAWKKKKQQYKEPITSKEKSSAKADEQPMLPKEEIILSKIKNPFQSNSTIEQEVKVINRAEQTKSMNNVIKRIRQHMFHHFDHDDHHGLFHVMGYHDPHYHHGHHGFIQFTNDFIHDGMHHGFGDGFLHDSFIHDGGFHPHEHVVVHHDGHHHDGHHGFFHHDHHHDHHHGAHVIIEHGLHHWPWHMSIQEEHVHGWYHLCHGAMIGHHSVLTTAECVYHKPLPSLRVVRHNLIDKVITLNNSSYITARIIHPKYSHLHILQDHHDHHHHHHLHDHHVDDHNLAILHLHHDMGVHPIGLHHGVYIHDHDHDHGHLECAAHPHASAHFISNEECDFHFAEHIGNTHVCAYGLPCDVHHHHGSPLVCAHHGHGVALVGLSSYQGSCGHHHPTVYERIAPHSDWITSHIK